jgi:hypothetical protein
VYDKEQGAVILNFYNQTNIIGGLKEITRFTLEKKSPDILVFHASQLPSEQEFKENHKLFAKSGNYFFQFSGLLFWSG